MNPGTGGGAIKPGTGGGAIKPDVDPNDTRSPTALVRIDSAKPHTTTDLFI